MSAKHKAGDVYSDYAWSMIYGKISKKNWIPLRSRCAVFFSAVVRSVYSSRLSPYIFVAFTCVEPGRAYD